LPNLDETAPFCQLSDETVEALVWDNSRPANERPAGLKSAKESVYIMQSSTIEAEVFLLACSLAKVTFF
jgi:hypothetical protein